MTEPLKPFAWLLTGSEEHEDYVVRNELMAERIVSVLGEGARKVPLYAIPDGYALVKQASTESARQQ